MGKPPFLIIIRAQPQARLASSPSLSFSHTKHLSPKTDKRTDTHMVVWVRSEVSVRRICGGEMRDRHHRRGTSWSHLLATT